MGSKALFNDSMVVAIDAISSHRVYDAAELAEVN